MRSRAAKVTRGFAFALYTVLAVEAGEKNQVRQMYRAVAWFMLIWFGVVALLGSGLHLLGGCHPLTHQPFDSELNRAAHAHAACCGCSCSSEQATEDHIHGCLAASHDHECAVCRFLALARELPRLVVPPDVRFVRAYSAELSIFSLPPRGPNAYDARAPPADSLILLA
jgi:hypothetical protein